MCIYARPDLMELAYLPDFMVNALLDLHIEEELITESLLFTVKHLSRL